MLIESASAPTPQLASSKIECLDSNHSDENGLGGSGGWIARLTCNGLDGSLLEDEDSLINSSPLEVIQSPAGSECGSEVQVMQPLGHSTPDLRLFTSPSSDKVDSEETMSSELASCSDKPTRRREWLVRLTSLGRSSPSQTVSPDHQLKSPETAPLKLADKSPSRKGYFGGLGLKTCMMSPPHADEIAMGEEKEIIVEVTAAPRVILTSNDFLDFVLSFPGNRVQKITMRTVIERVQSSSDVQTNDHDTTDRQKHHRSDYNSHSQQDDNHLRSSQYNEYHLIQCPSAPMSLHMNPIILIPGGGIFYFWKAGFTMYLKKHFDLSECIFMGTSAGALASIVTLATDNIARASRLAIKMAMQRQVWEKPYFLAGVLHNLSGQWLERVIPQDLDIESIKNRLLVIAYRVSRVRLEGLCHFQSRQDLIECLLASIHIPFYANGRAATKARGINYLDGSFGPDIIKTFAQGIPTEKIVLIRCGEDDYVTPIARRECIRKLPPKQMLDLIHTGFAYAEKLHRAKKLVSLMKFEINPPGTFSTQNDPYLDYNRLDDDSLD